uniref:Uncharacterized protein n=1 Tax=Anguilla anguilla TaxID=7936 RepID=A0A0E9WLF8_ANGAN
MTRRQHFTGSLQYGPVIRGGMPEMWWRCSGTVGNPCPTPLVLHVPYPNLTIAGAPNKLITQVRIFLLKNLRFWGSQYWTKTATMPC